LRWCVADKLTADAAIPFELLCTSRKAAKQDESGGAQQSTHYFPPRQHGKNEPRAQEWRHGDVMVPLVVVIILAGAEPAGLRVHHDLLTIPVASYEV
jgi:hypothetical protein